jgi:hypothetical protein
MAIGEYNAVRVGDLEIAMILARELRGSAGRPSVTLSQLQTVFDASQLDSAVRERIDAALESAGLQTIPSVLSAHPDEALVFTFPGGEGGGHPRRRFARAEKAPAAEPAAAQPAAEGAPPPVAAILAGVVLPVVLTTLGGWRFGISFVGFTAIAAGFLLSRPDPAAVVRSGRTFLIAVAGLCLVSVLGAVALPAP